MKEKKPSFEVSGSVKLLNKLVKKIDVFLIESFLRANKETVVCEVCQAKKSKLLKAVYSFLKCILLFSFFF